MKNPLRGRTGVLVVISTLGLSLLAGYQFFFKTKDSYANFDSPKMMVVVMDGIPLRRDNGQPLDVMIGEAAQVKCQRVSPPKDVAKARFHFDFGDGTPVEDHPDCDVKHTFVGEAGKIVTVDMAYFVDKADGTSVEVDRYRSEMHLVPQGQFFRLRGFGTPSNEPIQSLTVPHLVIPYVDSALELDRELEKKDGYAIAFFVQRDGEDVAYLRVAPPKEGGQAVRAITSPLKYYRDFGHFRGLAGIPEEPIEIGQPEDDRVLFQIYAGLFKKPDIDTLLTKCCGGAANQGVLSNAGLHLDEIRALTVDGRLTEPLRVVRTSRVSDPAKVAGPAPLKP